MFGMNGYTRMVVCFIHNILSMISGVFFNVYLVKKCIAPKINLFKHQKFVKFATRLLDTVHNNLNK